MAGTRFTSTGFSTAGPAISGTGTSSNYRAYSRTTSFPRRRKRRRSRVPPTPCSAGTAALQSRGTAGGRALSLSHAVGAALVRRCGNRGDRVCGRSRGEMVRSGRDGSGEFTRVVAAPPDDHHGRRRACGGRRRHPRAGFTRSARSRGPSTFRSTASRVTAGESPSSGCRSRR